MRAFSTLIGAVVIGGGLGGCASRTIQEQTAVMVGQPLTAAIAKLGVPTDERTIAGMKVYIWSTRSLTEGTEQSCRIRAIMQGSVIGSFDFEGNNGTCMTYARMLQT